jgi:MFS family permease
MQKYTLSAVHWAVFLVSFPFGILAFVLLIYAKRLGAGALEIGGLFSAFTMMTVVSRPLVGRALDRFGRRPFFLAGIGCYLLSQVFFALSEGIGTLYLVRMAQGLGSSLLWLSAYAIVADLVPEVKRGGGFGRVDELSARGALYGAILGFIPAALAYSFFPSRLGKFGDRAGRKPLIILGLLAGGVVSLLMPGVPSLWHLAFLWALEAVCSSAAVPAQQALVADITGRDVRGTVYGFYTMASGLGATVGPFLGGWLYDVHGHATPFYLNALVLFLGAIFMALPFVLKSSSEGEV